MYVIIVVMHLNFDDLIILFIKKLIFFITWVNSYDKSSVYSNE